MSTDEHILRRVAIHSNNVDIEPVGEVSTTPLAQIGVGDSQNQIGLNLKENDIEPDISNCCAPSAIVVALVTIIVLATIFMIYMYIQSPGRQLFFNISNNITDLQVELENDIYFLLAIGFWMAVMIYIVFQIDSSFAPFKLSGKHRTPSTNIPNAQFDIYILLGNLGLLLLAIISIVYLNNIFFMILFALTAIVVLLAWRPNPSFALLALAEIVLLTIFGIKFRSSSK